MNQEYVQAMKDLFKSMSNEMHTALPGKIVSFDAASCTATVQPVMKYTKPDKSTIDFPELPSVPVVFPQGAGLGVSIAFPVVAGDTCLLVFSEQSIDYWRYGQETGTDLRFDVSNAMCIPGLFTSGSEAVQKACAENAAVMVAGGTSLTVSSSGVSIKGNLSVDGGITSTGDTVAQGKSVASHTHTGDSGGMTSSPN